MSVIDVVSDSHCLVPVGDIDAFALVVHEANVHHLFEAEPFPSGTILGPSSYFDIAGLTTRVFSAS